ncbi:MAG: hypothetical protein GKR96_12185 [Gammaproteobacteria bacterium]|nr:hypothetical protein [Gammaproteobacteria bacterium]
MALTYNLELDSDVDFTPLTALRPYVLIAASHPFAKREKIQLEELVDENLILLDLPLSREYFMSLFQGRGLKPKVYASTRQTDVLRSLVAKGYGYSIANVRPKNQLSLDGGELVYLPLSGNYPSLTLGTVTLKNLHKTRSVSTLIQYCIDKVNAQAVPGFT